MRPAVSGDLGLDVIGDVHGHADKLERLLAHMGYREHDGVWRHPERLAVFVGDLIDRGPSQLDTVRIARSMVENGAARIVMGNHEYNAIAWATPHPEHPGQHLRTHRGDKGVKNRHQHRVFLDQVGEDSSEHGEIIEWFKTLPLWCDLDGVRIVHACWDPEAIELLRSCANGENTLTPEMLVASSTEGTAEFAAIETLLKGPEVKLPPGFEYLDKDDVERDHARYAWWQPDADTYRGGVVMPEGVTAADGGEHPGMPRVAIATKPCEPYRDAVPLFVGHYWRTGTPVVLGDHVACVDYSAGKGDPLVAYRWDGEQLLSADGFVVQP